MIVAGLQTDIAWEDPAENFRRVTPMLAEAKAVGSSLAVLPELFATGFSMASRSVAEHAAETRAFLAGEAARHGLWVLAGYAEPGDEKPRNACSLFDPEGQEQLRYHKVHPFSLAGEHEHYEGGSSLPTAEVDGVRVTAVICYDLRFPELFRLAADETDLFVVIANWPERRSAAWRTLLAARAIENQAFVLGVNRVGEGGGLPHRGDTSLFDPMGTCVTQRAHQVGLVWGGVDAAEVIRVRQQFGFLQDRRPMAYTRLSLQRTMDRSSRTAP